MGEGWIWPVGLAVLGAIGGSFMAALTIRWQEDRSIVQGRSACDACDRPLRWFELVPLASAAIQRGQCRTCGARIDPRHWQIEGCAALIGLMSGLVTPSPVALAGAVFGWFLLTLAALDIAALWLPDRLTLPLALLGLGTGLVGVAPPLPDRMIGGVAGFASLWLVAAAYRRVRGREGMGGGDPKLFGATGLWLGWRMLPAVLLIACLIGLALVLLDRLRGREVRGDTQVPLGALLAIAAYPAWLAMIGWPS